jgi:hypothetical protein
MQDGRGIFFLLPAAKVAVLVVGGIPSQSLFRILRGLVVVVVGDGDE